MGYRFIAPTDKNRVMRDVGAGMEARLECAVAAWISAGFGAVNRSFSSLHEKFMPHRSKALDLSPPEYYTCLVINAGISPAGSFGVPR